MARLLFLQSIEHEFMGPMYLSSYLRKGGHECRLLVGRTLDDFHREIARFKPHFVAFSVMSGSHRWAIHIAGQIKKEFGIPNIFGGPHPTFFPEMTRDERVDVICRGEGEEAALELLNRVDKGLAYSDVPNLHVRSGGVLCKNSLRPLIGELDECPYPDRELYDSLDGRLDRSVRSVITSRGCPFHCAFCFEEAMRELYRGKGKYVRLRRIDRVIEECRILRDRYKVRTIYFADDVFGMSKSWLYEFLPRYRRDVGLPFICLVRADIVSSDEEYAFHLAEGGCRSVFFGIETGNETLRNRVLAKRLSDAQICRAAEFLHKAGIRFRTYNILGLPGETLEDALSTVQMNIDIGADYLWCSVFMPFPGTELARLAAEEGFVERAFDIDDLGRSFFTCSNLVNMPHIKEMQNLQKFFQTAVLWPWSLPIIRKLIRIPPNTIFNWWFGLIYFLLYVKSEGRGFWQTLKFAVRNYRHILAKE
ncbi:MAG: B12-binding domain-containing radical SAM protein [Armatimonadetes bacterium]|nr:B12-binding domain-containing radical SAM protein [Armatimonadota bacterium]